MANIFKKIRNYKCILPIIIMICTVILIQIYSLFLKACCAGEEYVSCDILNVRVMRRGKTCCSMWPISHFILFFILGLFFPDCWIPVLLMGVLWEIIEFGMGYFEGAKRVRNDGSLQYTNKWWAPNIYDIFFNTAGFFTGYGIRKLFDRLRKKARENREKARKKARTEQEEKQK